MSDAETRSEIRKLLEGGLETEIEPRADSDEVRQPITDKLRAAGKLEDKLAIAGFTLKPVKHDGTEESCESCMRDSLCWPYGVAACGATMVVADSGNSRVLLWEAAP